MGKGPFYVDDKNPPNKEAIVSEITFELTNHCPHKCKFCSSDAGPDKNTDLDISEVSARLDGKTFDIINLSGGEPLSHPQFWEILIIC